MVPCRVRMELVLRTKRHATVLLVHGWHAWTEATSSDYNTVRALYDGKIDTFVGFKFIHSERLQKNASGYWRVPAWRKSAMGLGINRDIESQSAPRPDKRFAQYVYCDESIGGARLEEAKLVELVCQ